MGVILNFIKYKQNDPTWANYSFCRGGILQTHGCGPTALAILLGVLPTETAKWLTDHGYASSDGGTDHAGIYMCMRAYGYDCTQITGHSLAGVMDAPEFKTMEQTVKAGYCVIVLAGGVSTGCRNSYWTPAGHYFVIVGYDPEKGFLVYDPAGYTRDGYHWLYGSAEDCFNGNIKHIFITNLRWNAENYAAAFNMNTFLKGTRDPRFKLVQAEWNADGFYAGNIDGDFGDLSDAACRRVQKAFNLVVDGSCGQQTQQATFGLLRNRFTFYVKHVQLGSRGESVKLAQCILWLMRFYAGPFNGAFTEEMDAAVKKFQTLNNLDVDGSIGSFTWEKLLEKYQTAYRAA